MRTRLAALTVLALLATGCGSAPDTDTRPTDAEPTPTSTPGQTPDDTATQPEDGVGEPAQPSARSFPADTKPDDGGYGKGGPRWVTAVRTARNDGFDRIVFDLKGPGRPGWYVRYIKKPRQDGSGDPVAVDGDTYLQVVLRGIGYPGFDGIPDIDLGTTPGNGTSVVTEVVPAGVFEGDQLAFIGLTGSKRAFRVFALRKPTRVVVDIRVD
jgi:hypothetical protein